MRIIINHLTRMQPGFICVAGVDVSTGRHVRPVLRGRLSTGLLERNGGLFDMASLVDLGPVSPEGHAPEVEDYLFQPQRARNVNVVAAANFWALLQHMACRRLVDIFGPELRRCGGGYAMERGKGAASLGCLIPFGRPSLALDRFGSLRLRLTDGAFDAALSVSDIRLYRDDHVTPDPAHIADVTRRLGKGVQVILSMGVTRPWQRRDDVAERHWLQVNGIHLEDNPAWRLG